MRYYVMFKQAGSKGWEYTEAKLWDEAHAECRALQWQGHECHLFPVY